MAVLYRKYRPQTFADVVGQAHVTRTLARAIATDRVVHAYLFSGPRGVGKTTTARLLAKAVNCEGKREEGRGKRGTRSNAVPCNACDLCVEITEGRCVDVMEIDAASHTGVDHVREQIIDTVRMVPTRAKRKVFIIDEVHMLSPSAFNALLKTLEEPPSHALFILATTELHRVPETIRSRCQQFAFRRVALSDLEQRLRDLASSEDVEVDGAVVASIARTADGSVRDAESMLGQLLAFGEKRIGQEEAAFVLPRSSVERAAALVSAMERKDCAAALAEVHVAEDGGFDAEAYVRDIIAVLRDAVVAEIGDVARVAERVAALRVFAGLLEHLGRSDHPFFAVEVAVLQITARDGGSGGRTVRDDAQKKSVEVSATPRTARKVEPQQVVSPPIRDTARVERATTANGPPSDRGPFGQHEDEATVHADDDGALTRIRSAWSALVTKLADVNAALPYLLEGGRPQRVADGVLTIGFRYQLHAEKVKRPDSSAALADAVSALLGTKLRIATAIIGVEEFQQLDAASRPPTGDAVADAALEVFGGRVVE